jgi:hypothetical protein
MKATLLGLLVACLALFAVAFLVNAGGPGGNDAVTPARTNLARIDCAGCV